MDLRSPKGNAVVPTHSSKQKAASHHLSRRMLFIADGGTFELEVSSFTELFLLQAIDGE